MIPVEADGSLDRSGKETKRVLLKQQLFLGDRAHTQGFTLGGANERLHTAGRIHFTEIL